MASEDKNAIIPPSKDVEMLLLELKVLVNELKLGYISYEEYIKHRDIIIEKLVEAC